jgi:hypothetical protein
VWKTVVIAAVGGLLSLAALAGPATAGPGLTVGFAEDAPKWDGGASVTAARVLGADGFRITVPWKPGQTEVSERTAPGLDDAVTAAFGLRVVLAVYGDAADAPVDARRRDQYCSYVRSLLERYPTVDHVVVWNEPNSSRFWSPQFRGDGRSAAPAAYEAVLARCWDVVHAYRSDVDVLAPATSAHGFDLHAAPRKSHSPINFILRVGEAYRGSGRDLPIFDDVAQHAYGLSSAERPWKRHDAHVVGLGDWAKLVDVLRLAFGGTAQPVPGECRRFDCVGIWYTEVGYQTEVPAGQASSYAGRENDPRAVPASGGVERERTPDADSPAPDQATQIWDAVRLAYCQPYVEGFFNFLLRDESDLRGWQSGVQWADGSWKPSLPAFRDAIAEAHAGTVDCSALKGGAVQRLDTKAPARPNGLKAAARSRGIGLRWSRSSERDLAGYQVYRSAGSGGPDTLLSGRVRAFEFLDRSAAPGTSYSYWVAAIDSAGNEGPLSAPVIARR